MRFPPDDPRLKELQGAHARLEEALSVVTKELDDISVADAELNRALAELSTQLAEMPTGETMKVHLTKLKEATDELRNSPGVNIVPAKAPAKLKSRKRFALRLAAATAFATASLGGLAYAGVLPDQLQDALSNAAAKAGFDLPASDNAFGAKADEVNHGQQGDLMRDEHSKRDESPGQTKEPGQPADPDKSDAGQPADLPSSERPSPGAAGKSPSR